MVDGLAADGLVERGPRVGKRISVAVSSRGRRVVRTILAARQEPLKTALDALDDEESAALAGLLERLLDRMYEQVRDSELMCRLCDRKTCVATAECPVGAAERRG
jgi:hypothetical protein